jgi:hypothetical protein
MNTSKFKSNYALAAAVPGVWLLATQVIWPVLAKNPSLALPFQIALLLGAVAFGVVYHRQHPATEQDKRTYLRMLFIVSIALNAILVVPLVFN